ncbi:MAG: hypothetical protein MUP76_04055 [Acidimicrobiia bacterium]|nr:hypothetical protein [Acidimicrobiia bacterium]
MRRVLGLLGVLSLIISACGAESGGPESGDIGTSQSITVPETSSTLAAPDVDPFEPDPFQLALEERLDDDGTLPLEAALDLFAAAVGPLPGADAGAFPDPDPHAATMALMAVAAHYGELTQLQRDAFLDAVEGPGRGAGDEGEVLSTGNPVGVLAAYQGAAQPAGTDYADIAIEARDEIARRVGRPLRIPVRIVIREGTEFWAMASPMRDGHFIDDGTPDECMVELWPERIASGDGLFVRSVVTHEVFHCFQYDGYDDLSATFDSAAWITEGQAFWTAAEIIGAEQSWVTNAYVDWLCRPEISLWKRTRASMGFYSTLATHGAESFWDRFDDMLGRVKDDAVEAAGVSPDDGLRLSATSRMNDTDGHFGDLWTLRGAGIPASSCRGEGTARPDSPWAWSMDVQDYASGTPFVVDVTGDVVQAGARGRAGAFEFADGTAIGFSGDFTGVLCLLAGGCECPDGRTVGDQIVSPGPTAVAVGGRAGEVSASLSLLSLEDACLLAAEVPRLSLPGEGDIDLEGGACVLDGGDLVLTIGYLPSYDARLQAEPFPQMNAIMFVRAVPGTWDTGTFHVSPVAGGGYRFGDGGLVVTLSEDLLSGTFTNLSGSGSFSCPRLLTPAEALAGP